MIETNYFIEINSENNEKKRILEKRKSNLERILDGMRRAVETNDAKLYNCAENSFLRAIDDPEYEKILPSQVKARFINTYHNIRASNKLLFSLIKLNELEEADNPYRPVPPINQVVGAIKNRRRGRYEKTHREYFPRERRISRVDVHSLKLALIGRDY